jgi:uncharacterized membrane protein
LRNAELTFEVLRFAGDGWMLVADGDFGLGMTSGVQLDQGFERTDDDAMTDSLTENTAARQAQFVLHPHRSLSPRGFLILMGLIGAVSFIIGVAFAMIGAWPVLGFFGLDAALIYLAFKLNYRSGRLYETIDVTPDALKLTRVHPSGRKEKYEFNSYWARVRLTTDRPDGRTSLRLVAQGREVLFGQFLTDDERRDVADALTDALLNARGGVRI